MGAAGHARPYALTLAGHDPSGGAGLTADLKAFEALGVQGLSVCTALTVQTEDRFEGLHWVPQAQVKEQAALLLKHYPIAVAKIGLVESWPVLESLVLWLKQLQPHLLLVWDPILKASAGFDFHSQEAAHVPEALAQGVDLITPNWEEMAQLMPALHPEEGAAQWSHKGAVLLKGGHNPKAPGTDYLYQKGKRQVLPPLGKEKVYPKHGSGCVLSAAIAACLANDPARDMVKACSNGKAYLERYLASSESLLGQHFF